MAEADAARLDQFRRRNDRFQNAQERARTRIGVEPANLRSVVNLSLSHVRRGTSLRPGAFSVEDAVVLGPDDPAFAGAPTWQSLIDEPRPSRPPGCPPA